MLELENCTLMRYERIVRCCFLNTVVEKTPEIDARKYLCDAPSLNQPRERLAVGRVVNVDGFKYPCQEIELILSGRQYPIEDDLCDMLVAATVIHITGMVVLDDMDDVFEWL